MKLINRQTKASEAYNNWTNQYGEGRSYHSYEPHQEVSEKLKQLGDNPDPDDVDKAIGNKSWTCLELCSECDRISEVVMLGEALDIESRTAFICLDCLKEAVALIEGKSDD